MRWRRLRGRFDRVDRSSGGDDSEGETPGPIPNPAVKPFYADGSWSASSCESRSLPTELLLFNPSILWRAFWTSNPFLIHSPFCATASPKPGGRLLWQHHIIHGILVDRFGA